jgi:hypothetical protein
LEIGEKLKKTEELLSKAKKDSNNQKDSLLEMEELRTENMKLQKQLKDLVINSNNIFDGIGGNSEIEKYKNEVKRLENIVRELKGDISNKRPISSDKKRLENEFLELEVKYHKVQSRVRALENEIDQNARRYAQEVSRLKMILNEKESIIETLRMENAL